jgi:integrase
VQAAQVAAFVASQVHLQPKSLALLVSNLRSFLRYLCQAGSGASDLSAVLPPIRVRRDARIPSIWRREDVTALLAAVDRSSPKGKRDYAILLLACRLGLRVSDIRRLHLEQLRWDEARIELQQAKTGHPLSLPLSEEVGSALIDYLRSARPATTYREVFLRVAAPFEPFGHDDNLYHLITFYRRRAGIALPLPCRRGLHSLRHTLATQLLEAETPFELIAAILGHQTLESAQLYTKVDIRALRGVALDPQEVSHA